MARTPLAGAVQDAVATIAADERRTTRSALRQGGRRRGARPHRARPLRRARPRCGGAEDRRRRRRPRRAQRRVRAPERGLRGGDPRGLGPDRRPLLDAAGRVRRRPDRRARRRAHRHGPQPHPPPCAGARAQARQPAAGGAERRRAARLVRRRAVSRRRDVERPQGGVAEDPRRRSRRRATRPRSRSRPSAAASSTTCRSSTGSRRPSQAGSTRGSGSSSTSPTTSSTAPSRPSRARSTCSTCSPTAARGTCASSAPRTRSTASPAATTGSRTGLAAALPGQITTGSELVAVRRNASGTFTLTFAQQTATTTVTADKVVLALPFSILRSSVDISKAGFEPLKLVAIRELGMGTNSKLHVQFSSRFWNALGLNGETYSDRGYQSSWEVSRAQPGTSGILVDYTGGKIGASFGSGTPESRAKQFLAQIEPVLPGRDEGVERQGGDRLLARVPLDEGLVLVLEGGPVPALRRDGGAAPGQLPLRRRAHVDRLPGLPERGGGDRAARRRRDPGRLQVGSARGRAARRSARERVSSSSAATTNAARSRSRGRSCPAGR